MAYEYALSMAILLFTTYCHHLSLKVPALVPGEEKRKGAVPKKPLGFQHLARYINIIIQCVLFSLLIYQNLDSF
jgi:hypothetical protein